MPHFHRLIFDASSLIFLAKLDALSFLSQAGWAIMPESVADEVMDNPQYFEESGRIDRAMRNGLLRLREPHEAARDADFLMRGGEGDCLRLFREGQGDEIITDDVAVLRHLYREGIPFRNTALLVADWIREGIIDRKCGRSMLHRLKELVRYPDEIWAQVEARC